MALIDVDVNVALDAPVIGCGCRGLHLDIEDADVFLTRLSRWRVLDAVVVLTQLSRWRVLNADVT